MSSTRAAENLVDESGVELRTRRVGEIIDVAVRLTIVLLRKLAPLLLLIEVPFAALVVLIALSNDESGVQAVAMGAAAVFAMFLPAVGIVSALTVHAAHDAYLGREIRVRHTIWQGIRRLPFVFFYAITGWISYSVVGMGVGFASGFAFLPIRVASMVFRPFGDAVEAIASGFLALIVMIVWLALQLGLGARFLVGLVTVVIEKAGPIEGIRRGWRLTRKVWVRHGFLLMVALVFSTFVFGVSIVLASWLGGTGRGPVASAVGSALFFVFYGLLAFPFWASMSVALYLDGRVRAEAFDLERRMELQWLPPPPTLSSAQGAA